VSLESLRGVAYGLNLPSLFIGIHRVALMPWKCPACETPVHHLEEIRRTDTVYRCPICHLDLVFDATLKKMLLAPTSPESKGKSDAA